jgi:hypothetical protein
MLYQQLYKYATIKATIKMCNYHLVHHSQKPPIKFNWRFFLAVIIYC